MIYGDNPLETANSSVLDMSKIMSDIAIQQVKESKIMKILSDPFTSDSEKISSINRYATGQLTDDEKKQIKDEAKGLKTPSIIAIVQSGNLYVYCGNNPVLYFDPSGLKVYLLSASAAASLGLSVGVGAYAVIDDRGNIGVLGSISGGGGEASASAGFMVGEIDSADTIYDLEGTTVTMNVTIGEAVVGMASITFGDEEYSTMAGVGIGVGAPFDVSAQYTTSKMLWSEDAGWAGVALFLAITVAKNIPKVW